MKSYLDLVKEYGRVHKNKNRITVLCIAIAVCLVTTIFGMADMDVRSEIITQIKENGNWHMSIKNIDYDTSKLIGNRVDVAAAGWVQNIGKTDGYMIQGKPLSAIAGVDKKIAGEMGLNVIKGRYPENINECLLDQQALSQFGLSIGSKAFVTSPGGAIHTFTIVGIYNDFSSLKKADAHGLCVSYDSLKQLFGTNDRSHYFVKFKSGINMQKAIDEIKKSYKLSDNQVSENTTLLGMIGQSRDNYMMQLYMVAGVLFILVLAAGILMIASSFNMNVLERIKFFGLLRCLGASKSQVKKFVLLEGIRFSMKGTPIGILIGTAITWGACAFLKYVNPTFFSNMPLFGISYISWISGIAVGFLVVILASLSPCKKASGISPLSAVTGNVNEASMLQSKMAVKIKHGHIENAMGIYHAFASKKNILLMTGSFAISIILFLSFSIIISFMHHALKPLRPYTPDISIISAENKTTLNAKLLEKIKNVSEVKRVYGRMFAYDIPVTNSNESKKINLISYEENQFNWAKSQLVKGNITEVENRLDSVLVVYGGDMKWKVGDIITLKLSSGEKKVKIAGILSSSPFESDKGTQNVICSENAFKKLTGADGYTIIDVQLKDTKNDKTVNSIRNLISSEMKFSDQRQGNDENKTAFYSFAIFGYGFLLIIALIAVFNIINSMNTSVSARMNQYGMMRSVGMSIKQLQHMVMAEAGTYSVCGCLAGCILGLPLHKFLYAKAITSHWGIAWQIPVSTLAIIVIIVFIAAVISVIGPVKKISKIDIVNVINAQ